jgi:hypothetical protein
VILAAPPSLMHMKVAEPYVTSQLLNKTNE